MGNLSEKEIKFIEIQKKQVKFSLISFLVAIVFMVCFSVYFLKRETAEIVYFMAKYFNINFPADIKFLFLTFELMLAWSGIFLGTVIGFSLANYLLNNKWLKIIDKLNMSHSKGEI